MILEREAELAQLAEAARTAANGQGCVVLVYGEAGIGKSSLVEAVRGQLPAEARMLVGRCDDLGTARILGPLRDLIGWVGAELTEALRAGTDRDRILTALRVELNQPDRPTVLAIEDVHWADEATLDVLRFLVRRMAQLPAVLVLTYRDDELGRDHPLHHVLGLVSGLDRRLGLRPLSPDAVRRMSGDRDAAEVFAATSGNPFFVTEVLAARTAGTAGTVPGTVVDTVLARLYRLDDRTRAAVEQLSVVPSAIDRRLVDALLADGLAALLTAEEGGLLAVTPNRVRFRHELTRRAIADALPADRRAELHARVLAALQDEPGADVARIVHHAAAAGDATTIVRRGPEAARAAAALGAHREAVAHYRLVLEHDDAFAPGELAELLEGYAVSCHTAGENDAAVAAQLRAVQLRRVVGPPAALGAALRWLSRVQWFGDPAAGRASGQEAIEVLESLDDPRLLALAYSNQAQMHNLGYQSAEAVPAAERAVALATEADDKAVLSHALNNLGRARWQSGDPAGRADLEQSLRVALVVGDGELAGRAYFNLSWGLVSALRPAEAMSYLTAGIALAERAEHLTYSQVLHATRGLAELAGGRWEDAIRSAEHGLGSAEPIRCGALAVIARALFRTGRPAQRELDESWRLAGRIGEIQVAALAVTAICENAWLGGDPDTVRRLGWPAYDAAQRVGHSLQAELGYWLFKVGEQVSPARIEHPYALQTAGRWRDAAQVWDEAGYPYERAAALAESPDLADLLVALEELDALGAVPLAGRVRRQLRDRGVVRIPRGPTSTTRRNQAGLTRRQMQVLGLLAEGLSNAEIADRLVLSVRTAGNHVAAVLAKLGVHSREDAAAHWDALRD